MSDLELIIFKIAIYSAMIVILVVIAIDLIKNDREISKRISKHKKKK